MDQQTPTRLAREFWQRKNGYHIQMYEYGRYTSEEFLTNMQRLGWDRQTIIDLMNEDD